MAKKFEKLVESNNARLLEEDEMIKKDTKTGKIFTNKLSYIECGSSTLEDVENNYIMLEGN